MYFISSSFQAVCGELIGVVQGCPLRAFHRSRTSCGHFATPQAMILPKGLPHSLRCLILLVGVLSPVNHNGLHQGWKQTSIHLLLIPHNSHQTPKFFKVHKISLITNIKQNIRAPNTNFQRISYHPC